MFRPRLVRFTVPRYRRAFHAGSRLLAYKPYLLADIGEGIKECEVIQWFVEPGAKIEEFDPICEVQSDKASVEITSRYNGVIKKLHYEPGQMALVGKPLVDIDMADEVAEKLEEEQIGEETETVTVEIPEPVATTTSSAAPEVAPAKNGLHALATPAVRRICRELNIEITQVTGTGKDGRVLKEDVQKFSQSSTTPNIDVKAEPVASTNGEVVTPLTALQKIMFQTMTNSLSIPHFLYTDEVHMDRLVAMRQRINQDLLARGDQKVTFMPFFIKALSLALTKFPVLNSRVSLQEGKPVLLTRPQHNIGVAMDTPAGLIVPNIKNVESKTLMEISDELKRLQALGKDGKLTAADLRGGTITISNIGTVGGTYVAPVIVDSEVAIVGLGKANTVPRYNDKMEITPTTIMNSSWSGDHRVVDGMTMARMVDQWKSYVEHPERMLMYTK